MDLLQVGKRDCESSSALFVETQITRSTVANVKEVLRSPHCFLEEIGRTAKHTRIKKGAKRLATSAHGDKRPDNDERIKNAVL